MKKYFSKKIVSVCLMLLMILILFAVFFYSSHRDSNKMNDYIVENTDISPSLNDGQTLFEAIRKLADQMEVFPADIWAENQAGPLNTLQKHISIPILEKYRYDLTFERYVPLYEFKELVCRISKQELLDCVAKIDEATVREKSLILTMIFLFERVHRKKSFFSKREIIDVVLPRYVVPHQISPKEWKQLFSVIEKYKDDSSIAFFAIATPQGELLQVFEASQQKCFETLTKWDLPRYEGEEISGQRFYEKITSLKITSPKDAAMLSIIREYLFTFQGNRGWSRSGMGPSSGNSSSSPKTLGDIATQLLMSRYRYEE